MNAAVTYSRFANIAARAVRNSLREPERTKAFARERQIFNIDKFTDGKPTRISFAPVGKQTPVAPTD